MAMTYAELLQKYDLLRAVAEAAERFLIEPVGSTWEETKECRERKRDLRYWVDAAKDGGAM